MGASPLSGRYEQEMDRESAYELLKIKTERQAEIAVEAQRAKQQKTKSSNRQCIGEALFKSVARAQEHGGPAGYSGSYGIAIGRSPVTTSIYILKLS